MASGRLRDGGRNGRYLTVSVLHLVTIMCQGTLQASQVKFGFCLTENTRRIRYNDQLLIAFYFENHKTSKNTLHHNQEGKIMNIQTCLVETLEHISLVY
jgi:hypothetical protein